VTKLYSNLFSWSGDDKYNLIYLSDIGSDGKPGYIAMDRCKTQAVVADMSNLDNKKSAALVDGKKVDNNYCMRYMSKTAVVVSWGAKVIGGAAFVASMFTPAGWATWAAVALAAGGEVTSGLTDKYAQIWPSSG
jgi:hypothetical protein